MLNQKIILIYASTLIIRSGFSIWTTHYKCRGGIYPRSNVERFPVPDSKVFWKTSYPEYNPANYTSPSIYGQPWADPDIDFLNSPKWNAYDGYIKRESYLGNYEVIDGYPRNPIGRTGIVGRGLLGRWGPNHAADPVVTRWKKDSEGHTVLNKSKIPILQFVAIKRCDNGEWALPGGMVDPGENSAKAAEREFQEEAINSLGTEDHKDAWELQFRKFFAGGEHVYSGYIDDPRNTDNAWVESIAFNFHDDDGKTVDRFKLRAGGDACDVRWVDAKSNMNLVANHKYIVMNVLKLRLYEYKENKNS